LSLARIARTTVEARGEDWLTFPQRALFDRIGARNYLLEPDAWGNFIISGYDYGSAHDWIRFGLLHLWDGVWEGERILAEGWTDFVSSPGPGAKDDEYGGLFWLNLNNGYDRIPSDGYSARGFMGQTTMIIPSRDMVVVRLGPSPGNAPRYFNEFVGRVLDAVKRPVSQ
jgi:CubicO group peptidase (beta-lactamase class C family)